MFQAQSSGFQRGRAQYPRRLHPGDPDFASTARNPSAISRYIRFAHPFESLSSASRSSRLGTLSYAEMHEQFCLSTLRQDAV